MTITVRVPASTSNLGAGFDCLGLALDLWLDVTLVPGSGEVEYGGTLAHVQSPDLLLEPLERAGLLARFDVSAISSIPVGRGLGSSAAAIVASLALVEAAAARPLNRDLVFRDAAHQEGHPDNAGAAVYGGLVLALDDPVPLRVEDRLGIALAVPEAVIATEEARRLIPGEVPTPVAVRQSARLGALLVGLMTGDPLLVARGMEDQIAVPRRKTLIRGYDDAVRAGLTAGAFGVTISGAGSSLVAVGQREHVDRIAAVMVDALEAAGTVAVPMTPAIATTGVHVTRGVEA